MSTSLPFQLLVPGPSGDQRSVTRDRLADGVAIVSALAYGAVMVQLGDASKPGAAIPWWLDVAVGLVCACALFLRRRRPLAVCLALLPFGALSVMSTGPILVALLTAAIRCPPRLVVALAGTHILTSTLYYVMQHDPPMAIWVDFVMRAITGFAAIGWGLFLQAYRRLTRSLREQAAGLKAEQGLRMDQARLTERTRIAREMHDVLAHRMSMVSLQAGALEVRTDAPPEELAAAARAIRTSAHEALQELRTVIGVLRYGEASHSDQARSYIPRPEVNAADSSQPVTAQTEPAQSGPALPEATRPEPAQLESVNPQPTVLEAARHVPTPSRTAEVDPSQPESVTRARTQAEAFRSVTARQTSRLPMQDRAAEYETGHNWPASGLAEPPQPGLADLPDLVDNARFSGMDVVFVNRAPSRSGSTVVGRTAYRLVQEALTNARKHAPGRPVEVLLERADDDDLRILVTNEFHGDRISNAAEGAASRAGAVESSDVPGSSTGLIGVGERVALVGGRVQFGTVDDQFRFEAWLPWHR
jgi:signal transduction histidine kinase